MPTHRSFVFRENAGFTGFPNLDGLKGVVAPEILDAMEAASTRLSKLGIRHALVGGLAVGAYGHPRATKDVDFLVGDEAFVHHGGGFLSIREGVPIQFKGVPVDTLSMSPGEEEQLLPTIHTRGRGAAVPVISVNALIYLKLKSPRSRDASDIVDLLDSGVDPRQVADYLAQWAPDLIEKFTKLVERFGSEVR